MRPVSAQPKLKVSSPVSLVLSKVLALENEGWEIKEAIIHTRIPWDGKAKLGSGEYDELLLNSMRCMKIRYHIFTCDERGCEIFLEYKITEAVQCSSKALLEKIKELAKVRA